MHRAAALVIAPVLALGVTWTAHAAAPTCTPVGYTTAAGDTGYVADPPHGKPDALVVFFHGYQHTAQDWAVNHLCEVAMRDHVRTVAMDYGSKEQDNRAGWYVQEGANASVRAAKELAVAHKPTIAYGVSMGGNASGLAVIDAPGTFTWWVDIEGATNVIETYTEATALQRANSTAQTAVGDIETEMGGPITTNHDAYVRHDVVARASEVHVAGVIMCHGLGDGLVPYDQSREMSTALRAHGIPVDFTTWATNTHDEPGTTIDGDVDSTHHSSPFAGHATENSKTADVGKCGFDALDMLVATRSVSDTERFRDGHTGVGS